MEEKSYRVGELAEKAGVTRRTIHYYIGRGLIPPPEGEGLGAVYSDEHLYRIMLIKKLQDSFLPLDEIRKRTAGMDLREIISSLEGNAEGTVPVMAFSESSAGYVANAPDVRSSTVYERMILGSGLELHFPADNRKARSMAEAIRKFAEKMMKEG